MSFVSAHPKQYNIVAWSLNIINLDSTTILGISFDLYHLPNRTVIESASIQKFKANSNLVHMQEYIIVSLPFLWLFVFVMIDDWCCYQSLIPSGFELNNCHLAAPGRELQPSHTTHEYLRSLGIYSFCHV